MVRGEQWFSLEVGGSILTVRARERALPKEIERWPEVCRPHIWCWCTEQDPLDISLPDNMACQRGSAGRLEGDP